MHITISIVSHRQAALLQPLLNGLRTLSSTVPLRVIVTENVPDRALTVADDFAGQVLWIRNAEPKGFGANHNAAFRHCTTPYFMVLNPDVRFPEGAGVHALLEEVQSRPGVAGPRVLSPDGRVEDSARRVPGVMRLLMRRLRNVSAPDYPLERPVQQVDWIAGMCMLFDYDSFAKVSGFDERYHLYCEDIDICLRLHRRGRAVSWVQSARVIHDAQRQSHRDWRYLSWHIRSLIRLATSFAYWDYRFHPANRHT
ncbi:glycosyltransferase [Cupriavidus pinatubonensis]|uniref:glycosyltransferase n=1 Tax=Cupriavidus pinatubonensis TaxID=248026 RepID=UPI001C7396A0|nr:glycosyltransferase [Cupriavidus pinatubonensis]QYY32313.1 glycosyltransferase [Cupriavidus pinatubonensis]